MTKLAKTTASASYASTPYAVETLQHGNGDYNQSNFISMQIPHNYREEVKQCRFFYRYDSIASTVINRMSDMAITPIRNRRGRATDEEMALFDAVAKSLTPILQVVAIEYLVTGSAIIDYGITRGMGNRISSDLGRKRYYYPEPVWVRNIDTINLKRVPASNNRSVWLKITDEERYFIENEGKRLDGTEDRTAYRALVRQFPRYIELVKSGVAEIPLEGVNPILRRAMTHMDYPQPFLVPALASLKHKLRIKQMDYSIATKAIEAIRHVKAGDKDFPVTEDDSTFDELKAQMNTRTQNGQVETVYNLYTNHTIDMKWVYPPLEALMSEAKFAEPNADIFMAMGFSRVLLVGESLRSNSGATGTTTMGPIATLNEMREKILKWIRDLYYRLATANGFKHIPDPQFTPIIAADTIALVEFALEATKLGVLSKDTFAQMFLTNFEKENSQIEAEADITGEGKLIDRVYPDLETQMRARRENTVELTDEEE